MKTKMKMKMVIMSANPASDGLGSEKAWEDQGKGYRIIFG